MKKILPFVTTSLLYTALCQAQLDSEKHIVNTRLFTAYSHFTDTHLVKKTSYYGLKGNAKTVTETVSHQRNTQTETYRYEFLKNGNLATYQKGDTLQGFANSGALFELYTYNEATGWLTQITRLDGTPGHNTKQIGTFDSQGYIATELYDYSTYNEDDDRDRYVFDHTLTYNWNAKHNAVTLDYKYSHPESHYERRKNTSYSFEFNNDNQLITEMENDKEWGYVITIDYDSILKQPISVINKSNAYGSNSAPYITTRIGYDENGRIGGRSTFDQTVRNSTQNSSSYEQYLYNEHGDLCKVEFSGTNFFPVPAKENTLVIEYPEYDTHGNWTVKKVNGATYKREITYY